MALPAVRGHTGLVLARIRGWFDGAGWYLAIAGALFVVALIGVFGSLQVDGLMWTGTRVAGTERHGIVYYAWQGQSYTVDDPHSTGSAAQVNVYLSPANPAGAILDNPADRLLTEVMVIGPVAIGTGLVILGGTRKYRWERRNRKRGTADWWMTRIPR
jgi:hypothetical protein